MTPSRAETKTLQTDSTPVDSDGSAGVTAELAQRVASARRESGLTLATVAERSGLSPAFISQIESASANPTVATLAKVAAALGRSVGQLFGDLDNAISPSFAPRFAPLPRAALMAGEAGIWDLTAHGSSRMVARLIRGQAGDHAQPVSHPHEEFVCVLAGSCRLEVGGTVRVLGTFDACHLGASDLHQITEASEDLLLLIILAKE